MTRRTRRRVYAVALAAVIGAGSPVWAPPLLRTLPAFRVEAVEVAGETRFVTADEIRARARVPEGASVWDEVDRWTRRVESHPLVERARIRRSGFHTLEITVDEVRPVALAATPTLRPVSAGGALLPLDPAEHGLDLPILLLEGGPEEGRRLREQDARILLRLLSRLRETHRGFLDRVSSLRTLVGGGIEVRMVESTPTRRVLLPPERPVRALRRVELALGQHEGTVTSADARFRGQVVLDPTGGEG